MLEFHLTGDWDAPQVRTSWIRSSHALPPAVWEVIDKAWETASARPGIKLFDGPMCRLESWSSPDPLSGQTSSDGSLHLALSRTSYKLFLGTNMSHPELADRYGRNVLANPVGVSPALETSDGFLMFGRRNARVAYHPSRIHPFAGSLEPTEGNTGSQRSRSSGPDIFAAVRRELSEELGLSRSDVPIMRCTGIAEDLRLRQPELIFRAKTTLTAAQIESQVTRDEHNESWSVAASPAGVEAGLGRAGINAGGSRVAAALGPQRIRAAMV